MNQTAQLQALASASDLAEKITVISTQVRKDDGARVENLVEHVIEPFTYRKLFKVLGHVNNVFAAIGDFEMTDFDDPIKLAQLIMHALSTAGDDVQSIVALALDRPVDYLDTLMPDDGLKVTAAVVRVNKDFFVQRILPMVTIFKTEIAEIANQVAPAVGPTS